jgi:hypothetical protein
MLCKGDQSDPNGGGDMTDTDAGQALGTREVRSRLEAEFEAGIRPHVEAIHAGARDFLVAKSDGAAEGPRTVRIEVVVDLQPESGPTVLFDGGTTCWTETAPCGKTATGYILCTTTYCMTVGPVTLAP